MSTTAALPYRTKSVPIHDAEGNVVNYLQVPDQTDPAYQAYLKEHVQRLQQVLDRAAAELGVTRDELADMLSNE